MLQSAAQEPDGNAEPNHFTDLLTDLAVIRISTNMNVKPFFECVTYRATYRTHVNEYGQIAKTDCKKENPVLKERDFLSCRSGLVTAFFRLFALLTFGCPTRIRTQTNRVRGYDFQKSGMQNCVFPDNNRLFIISKHESQRVIIKAWLTWWLILAYRILDYIIVPCGQSKSML